MFRTKNFLLSYSSSLHSVRHFSSSASKERVGFVGLGNMGYHMANNLLKNGYSLSVFDINSAVAKKLKENQPNDRVSSVSSPKDLCNDCDVIITMLPSSPHCLQVYNNQDGILSKVRKDTLLIDSSTIDPNVSRQIHSEAKKSKAVMIDAPVSGGVGGAQAGTLTFMVGGDKTVYERAKRYLQSMGKNIVYCGDGGNGQVVKVCNNLVLAISMIGVSEAMNLGVKLGMDPKILAGIFNTSSARCWSSDTYNPVPGVMENVPASRGYTGGFGVDLMAKDVGLAINAATNNKIPLPLGSIALQVYNIMSNQGMGGKDFSSVYEFLSKKQ